MDKEKGLTSQLAKQTKINNTRTNWSTSPNTSQKHRPHTETETCCTHAARGEGESDCSLPQVLYGGPDWGLGAPGDNQRERERHTNTTAHNTPPIKHTLYRSQAANTGATYTSHGIHTSLA